MSRDFTIKIGGVLDASMKKSFETGSKEVNKFSKQLKGLKKSERDIAKVKNESIKLANQVVITRKEFYKQNTALLEASKRTALLKKKIDETRKPTQKMRNEFKRAKKEEDKLIASHKKQEEALIRLKRDANSASNKVKRLSKDEAKLAKEIEKVTKAQKRQEKRGALKKDVSSMGKKMIAPAVMIGIGVSQAISDEAAFADVKKQLNGMSNKEIKTFRQELLKATDDINLMNNQVYEIAAAAGQAGIAQEEMTGFVKDTAKVAVAFDMETSKSGEILATWRTSFGMTEKEVMKLADQVNTLSGQIKVTPEQVADMVTAVGGLGKQVGITEAQTAALGGTLINLGVRDAGTAGTALRKLYSKLSVGDAASKTVQNVYSSLGFDPNQLAKDMQKDSRGTINKVLGALSKVDKDKRLSMETQLFGEEAVGPLSLLVDHLKDVNENMDLVNDKTKVAGSVEGEYSNIRNTANGSLIVFRKNILNLGLAFSNYLLPPFVSIVEMLNSGAKKIEAFTQKYPKLTEFITLAGVAFVGLNLALWGGTVAMGVFGTALAAVNVPLLIAGGIIAGVAAGAYMLYKRFDLVKQGFVTMKNKIVSGIKYLFDMWKKYTPTGKVFSYIMKKVSSHEDSGKGTEKVVAHGKGGVMTAPHLAIVGDAPETIVPHDGTRRSKSLWYHAGEKLGMLNELGSFSKNIEKTSTSSPSGEGVTVHINPSFTINQDNKNSLSSIQADIERMVQEGVRKALEKLDRDKRRLSFG